MKGSKAITLLLMICLVFSGCGAGGNSGESPSTAKEIGEVQEASEVKKGVTIGKITASEGVGYPVTITDMIGNQVTIEKKPERIAAISGTFLSLLYAVGGESICTSGTSANSPIPPEADNLPNIGQIYNPNVEKIMELKPDLIIAQTGVQDIILPVLKECGIPVLYLQMRTYDDVINMLGVMGRIVNQEERAEKIIKKMEQDKKEIVDRLPKETPSAVILYVTSQDIAVKLSMSISGNVAETLKIKNIVAETEINGFKTENMPFSMETIIEKDPDVILVTSMLGEGTSAQQIIEEKLGKDPVWKNLRAVKENRIVYLPQKYFLYNAGANFVEAIEYMAKAVYPEIYGGLND
ncbi:iron complex transport system substrate-binding protein [Geosporobacter subterraneus DSM 17957]|uniref:Iron complex transport system substrate-binding protein n=1 Tax=Geosporobacter subterraneus DSM 17957 TaxID=1121919 RepID=A0A1M6Q671_9FIRM|nr:ABC transporter substrate-binding protein [Geosporobacter subterraneus]SHK15623.1 iron complex transport system substrate-binding protein [Geosporobacter subterraneus DSM 17957]